MTHRCPIPDGTVPRCAQGERAPSLLPMNIRALPRGDHGMAGPMPPQSSTCTLERTVTFRTGRNGPVRSPLLPPMKTRYIDLIEQTFDFPRTSSNWTVTTSCGTTCP